ncbi:SIR2 family NAD-dependent protein deacylase [Achromobacter arsenitoxydans]|uniref:NAD-dependent protein deacylase n=1 Tax=Achromobacter arsenitoxydans SY8 TaxID=477184 RepID=H0FF91_9BURK|nr:NAD-dependent deacylase [Achromobacter arsenitoxydans]EHK63199.1 Sir2 family transcriptional regulator [Achromobacter arsenitoxydans SY8]
MKNTHHDIPPALAQALRQARRVVVFTGAGVSAESGIATFRDALTGLWSRFDAQALATPEAFAADPDIVWGWYEWRRAQVLRAAPNAAHRAIADLARHVPELAVITQNVDDLHERAGSPCVTHLHGSLHAPRCSRCASPQAFAVDVPDEPEAGRRITPPACTACGAPVRPGVVWFGESLPAQAWNDALRAAQGCDLLFSIGTSSLVYPAAELPRLALAGGATVVQVNPAATPLDAQAHHNLRGAAADVMPCLLASAGFGEDS